MFLIRYYDFANGTQTLKLHPRPTTVEYPDRRLFTRRQTREGKTILQRPRRDSRSRKWIWNGYRPGLLATFDDQWAKLAKLEARSRWEAGHTDLTVLVWENESTIGGFDSTTDGLAPDLVGYTNLKFTKVKFIQVQQLIRDGGGLVTYDRSEIEFVVEDDQYLAF